LVSLLAKTLAANKKSGQQNETFRRRNESERLINELAGYGWQVGESHPHQHESAGCVEFQSPLHEFESSWMSDRGMKQR